MRESSKLRVLNSYREVFFLNYKNNTELKFYWLRLTLCISGVTGTGVPVPGPSLYNTWGQFRNEKEKERKGKRRTGGEREDKSFNIMTLRRMKDRVLSALFKGKNHNENNQIILLWGLLSSHLGAHEYRQQELQELVPSYLKTLCIYILFFSPKEFPSSNKRSRLSSSVSVFLNRLSRTKRLRWPQRPGNGAKI